MNIEKIIDLMTKDFIFCQLKDTLTKLQAKVSEKRLAMRSSITTRPINLVTIVSLLPFFLGFYDFLNQNKQLKKTLFQKNIPLFDIPTETLNWDTIRYFNQNKKEFLLGIEKIEWSNDSLFLTKTLKTPVGEQVFIASVAEKQLQNFSTVSSLIELEKIHDLQEVRKNQFYFNSFNKKAPGYLKKSIYFFDLLKNFYLHLDEIPLKIDNLIFDQSNFNDSEISDVSINDNYIFLKLQEKTNKTQIDLGLHQESYRESLNLPFQKELWKTNTNRISITNNEKLNSIDFLSHCFLKNTSLSTEFTKNQLPALNQINNSQDINSKTEFFDDSEITAETEFFDDSEITAETEDDSEITAETEFFDDSELAWEKEFLDKFENQCFLEEKENFILQKILSQSNAPSMAFFSEDEINDFETLEELEESLEDIDEAFFEKGFCFRRKMAGYFYPDMNVKKVSRFLLNNLFSSFSQNIGLQNNTQIGFKINFPANQNFLLVLNPKISNIKTN